MEGTNNLYLTIQLTKKAHQDAREFCSQQANSQKVKQVYINTLAVHAVDDFLQWMKIKTDLEAGDSWHPVIRCFNDVADLVIPDLGKLECRPVLPGEKVIILPPEVTEDRIGYVAIQFQEQLNEVQLVGFSPVLEPSQTINTLEVASLQPIENLINYLERLESAQNFLQSDDLVAMRLRQRLTDKSPSEIVAQLERIYRLCPREEWRYAGGEFLSGYIPTTKSFSFRGGTPVVDRENFDEMQPSDLQDLAEELLEKLDEIWVIDDSDESLNVESLNNPSNSERVKANQSVIISQPVVSIPGIINLSEWLQNPDRTFQDNWQTLESFLSNQEENLIFRFASVPRSRSADGETIMISETKIREIQLKEYPVALILNCQLESTGTRNIILRLYSNAQEQTHLPPGVQLIILDESGDIFDQVQAKSADNWIQLEVSGEPGERFAVKVALGEISITENFVI